jgi:hypothetical protein
MIARDSILPLTDRARCDFDERNFLAIRLSRALPDQLQASATGALLDLT